VNKSISLKASALIALVIAVLVLGVVCGAVLGQFASTRDDPIVAMGISHFSGLGIDMNASGTATPAFEVNQDGSGAIMRIKDGETPVVEIYNGGASAFTGDMAITGDVTLTGDLAPAGALAITVPTAEATAISGLDVTQNGVGEVAEFNDGATELLAIRNGGGVVVTGPTAVATAQPVLVVDNQSSVANSFEVRVAATPQVAVSSAGASTFTSAATFANAVNLTLVNAAGGSANPLDFTGTLGIMDGSDLFEAIDINITGAAHTGNGNVVKGIDIDLTTADPQVPSKAIDVSDTTFDYAIDAGAAVIFSSAQTYFEDFFGDTIADELIDLSGTDPQAVKAVGSAQYGVLTLTSGNDGANCAADCEEIALGLHWQADQGALIFETRAKINTNLTNTIFCTGLSDNAGLEMPFTIGGSDVVSAVADDAIAFCYDSAGDTDEWFGLTVAGTTEGTGSGTTGIAVAFDTWYTLRFEVDAAGADVRFYVDGVLGNSVTANGITITDPLTPFAVVDTNAAASVVADIDYIAVAAQRQ
jgi:hypothetical protein